MALWQYVFHLIPAVSTSGVNDSFRESFDTAPLWRNWNLPPDFLTSIENILPPTKSWSSHLLVYGNMESNDMQVFYEDGRMDSFTIRIDYRTDYSIFLNDIIVLCNKYNLIILDEKLNICETNADELRRVINTSSKIEKLRLLGGIQ